MPTFFEWSAYFYFVGTVNIGMSIEYKDFTDFINLRGVYAKMRPGSQIWPALKRASHFVIMVVIGGQLAKRGFLPKMLLDPGFVNEPFWWKLVAANCVTLWRRSTMYVGFIMMESTVIACGQGYDQNPAVESSETDSSQSEVKEEFNAIR